MAEDTEDTLPCRDAVKYDDVLLLLLLRFYSNYVSNKGQEK